MEKKERLFNRNFTIMSVASLFMFVAFYLLMPIIAMYVVDYFEADSSLAGVVAASYIITALMMRPFSGYLVDRFDRRKFYLIVFAMFAIFFTGYIISTSILELVITRVLLGATFAMTTTASNTLAIDVIPSSRRAEGIGYYGAIVVLAMAVGPMLGLYLIKYFSYKELFIFATGCAWVGVGVATFVRTKPREQRVKVPLSFDRFLLREGVSIASIIALLYFLYGTLMVYVSLYVRSCGINTNSANFFMLFALGIIIARMMAARYLRKGLHDKILQFGTITIITAGLIFVGYLTEWTLPIASIGLGVGFGLVAPSVQSMIIDLVPAARRGTANSTYFIALDLGSGIGMLVGGTIAHIWDYQMIYIIGIAICSFALILYYSYSRRNYTKHLEVAKKAM
ncbi:MAG: MFS transporter [Rikenellaceae bacterium]